MYSLGKSQKHKHIKENSDGVSLYSQQNAELSSCSPVLENYFSLCIGDPSLPCNINHNQICHFLWVFCEHWQSAQWL